MYYIYVLKEPETNLVRYVGMTKNPEQRHKSHIARPSNAGLALWVGELKGKGLVPLMDVIDTTEKMSSARRKERDLITNFYLMGAETGIHLLNVNGHGWHGERVVTAYYFACRDCGIKISAGGIPDTVPFEVVENPVTKKEIPICPKCGNYRTFWRLKKRISWSNYWNLPESSAWVLQND